MASNPVRMSGWTEVTVAVLEPPKSDFMTLSYTGGEKLEGSNRNTALKTTSDAVNPMKLR